MRSKPTNRKNYKTEELFLKNGFPYLAWSKYPEEAKIISQEDEGKRIWIAGTSFSEIWKLKKYHEVGTPRFEEGGLTAINKKGEIVDLFFNEAILHPKK